MARSSMYAVNSSFNDPLTKGNEWDVLSIANRDQSLAIFSLSLMMAE